MSQKLRQSCTYRLVRRLDETGGEVARDRLELAKCWRVLVEVASHRSAARSYLGDPRSA
jgi:hypothetical protein